MNILTGSEVLARNGFAELAGRKVGFVANHTARLNDGTPTLAAMVNANVDVAALFAPEHGAFGVLDEENIPDQVEPTTGLPIFSLYGEHRKPPAERLAGLDALVFEIQDIGARFYTYSSTLGNCLEAAWEVGIPIYILDRPNPVTGNHCEGPLADPDLLSFVAYHPIPVRHGLTLGELGRLYCAEKGWGDTARVVACEGWRRRMWSDETGVPWVNPSPAMRSLTAATVYPGVCLLEQTNVSVGRGTERPFERAGAPFIDGTAWVKALQRMKLPGVAFEEDRFTPKSSKHEGEECGGLRITITDRDALDSVRLGIALAVTLRDLYAEIFEIKGVQHLLVNEESYGLLAEGAGVDPICASWREHLRAWDERRRPYLLYV
ncbi:MAG TPA: DUF1343 domain-containing protein [Capsulimonadaceae bacterium]|nr:DUF1343 domain-containing protein [Capsulimonadaceae bacterium]